MLIEQNIQYILKNHVELMRKLYWKIKVGLSPSKVVYFFFFNENPTNMMKNAFYFI